MAIDLTVGEQNVPSNLKGSALKELVRIIDTGKTPRAQNDVLECFKVSKGTEVIAVHTEVVTAEGGTLTYDVGDGDDVDGYLDGVDGNVVGVSRMALALVEAGPNTVLGYSGGKLYTADDTIDLKLLNAADKAVIRLTAYVINSAAR